MKKINAIAWLITMLMTLVASPAFATDWGSENVKMKVGETKTLYLPSSVTMKTLKSVNFYSASYNVVEVVSRTNYSVKVKALKATSTPVIVRCDYYYYINNGGYMYQNGGAYDFKVTVEGETVIKPTKITLPSVVSVEVGESKDIVATVTPANAEYTLTWSISDNSIATVYQNGMITGKSVGYADLKVKADNGVYAMCRISVYQPTPTSVSMKSSLSMNVGDTYTLSASVYPTNSKYTLSWSSDNSGVATLSQSGVVTAKSAGTANITVKTDNGKTATCKVTVKDTAVTEHEVIFSIYGYENGKVLYNGVQLAGSVMEDFGSFKVTEGNDVALNILPNEGCEIYWLWVDYEDVENRLVNNELTLRDIKADTYIVVAFSENDTSTGINGVYNDNKEPPSENNKTIIYNLKGQRVNPSQARNGVFIINGKKVFIK